MFLSDWKRIPVPILNALWFGMGCTLVLVYRASVAILLLFGVLTLSLFVFKRLKLSPSRDFSLAFVTLAALVIWAIIALIWSPDLLGASATLTKAIGLILVGLFCLTFVPDKNTGDRQAGHAPAFAFSLGVAAAAVVLFGAISYANVNGDALWGSYKNDPLTPLNNSMVMLSLVAWPIILLWGGKSWGLAVAFTVLALGTVAMSSSLAALVGFMIGGGVLVGRIILGKKFGLLIAIVSSLYIAFAPSIFSLSAVREFVASHPVNEVSEIPSSARHRLAMWVFASDKISENTWLGWGSGASRHIPQDDARLASNMEIMPLHPHSIALQTRLELGVPGSFILSLVVFSTLLALNRISPSAGISGLCLATALTWLFVANVSFGMWQSWWIASIFIITLVTRSCIQVLEQNIDSPMSET